MDAEHGPPHPVLALARATFSVACKASVIFASLNLNPKLILYSLVIDLDAYHNRFLQHHYTSLCLCNPFILFNPQGKSHEALK